MTTEEREALQSADDAGRKPEDWQRYRNEEKARKAAEAKTKELERALAFRDAGINPADADAPPHTQLFVDGYKGELTPEAIKAEAVKMAVLKPEAPPVDPAAQTAQTTAADAAKNIDAASTGAVPEGGGSPVERIDEAYEQGGIAAVSEELKAQGIPTIHSP